MITKKDPMQLIPSQNPVFQFLTHDIRDFMLMSPIDCKGELNSTKQDSCLKNL